MVVGARRLVPGGARPDRERLLRRALLSAVGRREVQRLAVRLRAVLLSEPHPRAANQGEARWSRDAPGSTGSGVVWPRGSVST